MAGGSLLRRPTSFAGEGLTTLALDWHERLAPDHRLWRVELEDRASDEGRARGADVLGRRRAAVAEAVGKGEGIRLRGLTGGLVRTVRRLLRRGVVPFHR